MAQCGSDSDDSSDPEATQDDMLLAKGKQRQKLEDDKSQMRPEDDKSQRTTKRIFREADKWTWQAGLGRQFVGGTARGEHAPYLGQAHLAINEVVSASRSTTAP